MSERRRCLDCHRPIRKVIVQILSSTGVDLGTFGEKCGRKAAATYNGVGLNVRQVVTRDGAVAYRQRDASA